MCVRARVCKFALVSLSIHHVFVCLTSHLLAAYLCLARCKDPHRWEVRNHCDKAGRGRKGGLEGRCLWAVV